MDIHCYTELTLYGYTLLHRTYTIWIYTVIQNLHYMDIHCYTELTLYGYTLLNRTYTIWIYTVIQNVHYMDIHCYTELTLYGYTLLNRTYTIRIYTTVLLNSHDLHRCVGGITVTLTLYGPSVVLIFGVVAGPLVVIATSVKYLNVKTHHLTTQSSTSSVLIQFNEDGFFMPTSELLNLWSQTNFRDALGDLKSIA